MTKIEFKDDDNDQENETPHVHGEHCQHHHHGVTVKNENKIGRNDPCPCGSGKKFKKCCYT